MSVESKRILSAAIGVGSFLFTTMFSINAFFVVRLIDKVDTTNTLTIENRMDIREIKARLGYARAFDAPGIRPALIQLDDWFLEAKLKWGIYETMVVPASLGYPGLLVRRDRDS